MQQEDIKTRLLKSNKKQELRCIEKQKKSKKGNKKQETRSNNKQKIGSNNI